MNRRKKMSGGKSSTTSNTANRMKKAMKGMKYKQGGGKPDYIDIDGDGNRTESMKSAAKSKKNKKAKYGSRKKKMMGGMNNMQQDPNMMQQQPMDPMANQQAPMTPGEEFIEPDRQLKFGGPSRDKAFFGRGRGNRADRKAARQERRAARKEMRQDRRAARQEIRQLPREERRAARQEMRQDFRQRKQDIRSGGAPQSLLDQKANEMSAAANQRPAAAQQAGVGKPGLPPGRALPPAKPPVAAGMSTGGFDKNISAGQTAFKNGGKKPREKALFGRIANAIRKGREAKKAGKSFGEVAKAAGTGAMTGTLGLAAAGIKGLRSPKEAREARKEARRERRANRKTMTRAERRADRKAARQERRAARKDRRSRRKELRQTLREERRDVRANAGGDAPGSKGSGSSAGYDKQPPPMTAMVKNGARKNMVDRRVKKKSGGYGIEKTASGKKMADTLGVTKNRKKASEGRRRDVSKSNRLHAQKKQINTQIKESLVPVREAEERAAAAGKTGLTKEKKQLERRRAKVKKIEKKITKHRLKNRTP